MNKDDVHLQHNSFTSYSLQTDDVDSPEPLASEIPLSVNDLAKMLSGTPHLHLLCADDARRVAAAMLRREYGLLDCVLPPGSVVDHVFLVLVGTVEVFDEACCERVGTVSCGYMFGLDNVIFDEPSEFRFCSGAERTVIGLIPKGALLPIISKNVALAQSIGRKLADGVDIFRCFKEFCRLVFSHETAIHEYLPLWSILDAYSKLNNCIHAKMSSVELDVGAWSYAAKRLPDNLTSTFCFDLVRALPPFVASRMRQLSRIVDVKNKSDEGSPSTTDIRFVATKERRRCAWQLGMDGKTLVLLRDSFSDLLDFITCMCIHITESTKLRGRLQGMVVPPAVDILDEYLQHEKERSKSAQSGAGGGEESTEAEKIAEIREVLSGMPLSKDEQIGLLKMWGVNTPRKIYEVLMHREEFMLRVDASISRRFQTDPFHEWALNLRAAVMRKIGLSPNAPLPSDLVIDIISSNTHSTKNILSPFPRKHRQQILEYAKTKKELWNLLWQNEEDLVYCAGSGYMQASPTLQDEFNASLKTCGFTVMEDTAMTGLQVDIVPLNDINLATVDPLLRVPTAAPLSSSESESHQVGSSTEQQVPIASPSTSSPATSHQPRSKCFRSKHILLNMDFAFGAQAEGITRMLVSTFGKAIRSFNVMGKAGGLDGNRGDIQLASHVLLSKSSAVTEDSQDELRSCGNEDLLATRLRELIGPRVTVHEGKVLTIPGTMLQNVKLLKYYKTIWGCIGVEMEGSYFARCLMESHKAKLVRPDLVTRFAYYTSDLPLAASTDTNLATPMRPNEGVPPLYAIARAMIEQILSEAATEVCPRRGTLRPSTSPLVHIVGESPK